MFIPPPICPKCKNTDVEHRWEDVFGNHSWICEKCNWSFMTNPSQKVPSYTPECPDCKRSTGVYRESAFEYKCAVCRKSFLDPFAPPQYSPSDCIQFLSPDMIAEVWLALHKTLYDESPWEEINSKPRLSKTEEDLYQTLTKHLNLLGGIVLGSTVTLQPTKTTP